MSQNVFSPELYRNTIAEASRVPYWQVRSVNGDRLWKWIAWAFAAYWVLFVSGAFSGHKELNEVGAVIVLATLGWAVLDRFWVRIDSVAMASLALAFLPAIQAIGSTVPISVDFTIKHVSLCLVMALSRVLRLPVVSQSNVRRMLALQVLIILFISLTLRRGNTWDGARFSGMFANPNNLALIPFLLLLLVDRARDSRWIQGLAHAVVILVLAFTSTSGAVVAYVIGLGVYLSGYLSRRGRFIALSIAGGSVFLACVSLSVLDEKVLPDTRFTNQLFLMRSQVGKVLEGENIQYYQYEKALGSGSGSALWRVQHWRDTVVAYSKGTVMERIFGFGPGSSVAVVEILPHNEYLRMLFEEGVVGLILFLFAWSGIVRTAPPGIRYVALAIGIYSFSENNLDNFPFMALLVLCLSANVTRDTTGSETTRWPMTKQFLTRINSSASATSDLRARRNLLLS